MQIRCNFPDISYLSETQKNNFQFLSKPLVVYRYCCMALFHSQTQRHMINKKGLSVLYLPNQWPDFDQTDTDNSLGRP